MNSGKEIAFNVGDWVEYDGDTFMANYFNITFNALYQITNISLDGRLYVNIPGDIYREVTSWAPDFWKPGIKTQIIKLLEEYYEHNNTSEL